MHWLDYALQMGLPEPEREFQFAKEAIGRRWRFDYAWPGAQVALEVDGGAYTRGRHVRPKGFERDCEKLNAAAILGWRVLRFTPQQLERDPAGCVDQISRALWHVV